MATARAGGGCPCTARAAGRVFPVDRPEQVTDDRFSAAVVADWAESLAAHGFPVIEVDSPDWYALMWVAFRFVHGSGR